MITGNSAPASMKSSVKADVSMERITVDRRGPRSDRGFKFGDRARSMHRWEDGLLMLLAMDFSWVFC